MKNSSSGHGHWRPDTGKTARLAVGLLAVLLLLLNLGGWVMLIQSWRNQQRLLEQNLVSSAALIAGAIPPERLYFLDATYDPLVGTTDFVALESYAELPFVETLQEALADAASRHGDLTISILSNAGELIMNAEGIHVEPETDEIAQQDTALIIRATTGEVTASEAQPSENIRRVYYPLQVEDGTVVGVLRLVSGQPGADLYRRLFRRLLIAAIISTLLILFLWYTLNRLIRRSLTAEKMAYQSDRLRALGTATAGIAHEIRNPLGIITLAVEELKADIKTLEDQSARDRLATHADDLQEETARLRELTDQFLNLTRERSGKFEKTRIELSEAVQKTVRLFERGAGRNLNIEYERPKQEYHVLFGTTRLRQVLLNLMRNAQDAIGSENGSIVLRVYENSGRGIIEVQDNGPGMDAPTLAQVFDPFFTTRSEGTGLGLSLSRALVEAAGGELHIESTKGEGTTARLSFPLVGI